MKRSFPHMHARLSCTKMLGRLGTVAFRPCLWEAQTLFQQTLPCISTGLTTLLLQQGHVPNGGTSAALHNNVICLQQCWYSSKANRLTTALKRLQQARSRTKNAALASVRSTDIALQHELERNRDLIASVVNHEALVVTRSIEWGTVLLGFEQANKYTVYNEKGEVVALLAEDQGSFGTGIARQMFRTRRAFVGTVMDPEGNIIFRVRRPFRIINSRMIIEDADGEVIGELFQRWHLWRRNYDLYINKRQFAAISGQFLAWEFQLTNEKGGTLALIDRNFTGFGKELTIHQLRSFTSLTALTTAHYVTLAVGFTDAGKYVIHFGSPPHHAAAQAAETLNAAYPALPKPSITTLAKYRHPDMLVVPTAAGDQLAVVRNLRLSERMAVLAAAILIDYDYFSPHSHGSGLFWGVPMPIPMPMPSGSAEAASAEAAGAAAGAGGATEGAAAATGASDYPYPSGSDIPSGPPPPGETDFGTPLADDPDFQPDTFDGEVLNDGAPDWDGDGDGGGSGDGDGEGLSGLWEAAKGFFE